MIHILYMIYNSAYINYLIQISKLFGFFSLQKGLRFIDGLQVSTGLLSGKEKWVQRIQASPCGWVRLLFLSLKVSFFKSSF